MFIRMKFRCLALFFFALPITSRASQIDFVVHPGIRWELAEEARNKFNRFLEEERLHLIKRIPGLDFPSVFESVDAGIREYMSADSSKFRNRGVACSFLKRMRNGLSPRSQSELDILTKRGKVCTQADLSPGEQLDWTQKLAQFVWASKWIDWKGKHLSLQAYLAKILGESGLVAPRILVMKGSFEAWGIGVKSHQTSDH